MYSQDKLMYGYAQRTERNAHIKISMVSICLPTILDITHNQSIVSVHQINLD